MTEGGASDASGGASSDGGTRCQPTTVAGFTIISALCHPGLGSRRSGTIMLALAVASAGTATGLLLTQEPDSFGEGMGGAHAALAAGYALDGTLRLVNMARARRQRGGLTTGRASVIGPINIALNGLFTTFGALLFSLSHDASTRGAGLTFAVHGAWLTTFSIVQLVRARRGHCPWMTLGPSGLRF